MKSTLALMAFVFLASCSSHHKGIYKINSANKEVSIRKALMAHMDMFQECAVQYGSRDEKWQGTMLNLNFVITENGKVTNVAIESMSAIPKAINQCIANGVGSIKFSKTENSIEVKQPMHFTVKRS